MSTNQNTNKQADGGWRMADGGWRTADGGGGRLNKERKPAAGACWERKKAGSWSMLGKKESRQLEHAGIIIIIIISSTPTGRHH
jgi:hypothetical protein